MDLLRLSWRIDRGSKGVDNDPNNPLSRAVNRLLIDGRPITSISLCLFGNINSSLHLKSPLRWLGVFVLSAGKRVLFFPGFNFLPKSLQSFRGKAEQWDRTFEVDHVSLEKNLKRWHATSSKSGEHLHGGKTIPLGDGRILWVGMSVREETVLREVKKETVVSAQVPTSDSNRRVYVLKKCREGVEFPWVSLPTGARTPHRKSFLHFAFIVGPRGFPLYEGGELGLPFGSSVLSRPLPKELKQLPARSQRLSFGTEMDMQIVSLCLPGTSTQLVAFTSLS